MRKNKTTVQHHVFMTKFLPIEQHLSQLTLNICYKHIQIGVISLYFTCISSKNNYTFWAFIGSVIVALGATHRLPFALIAMISIAFFQHTRGGKMQTSYCYQPKLVCFHESDILKNH